MKKGLIMSAIFMALSGTASASLTGATSAAQHLSQQSVTEWSAIETFFKSTGSNIAILDKETSEWQAKYYEINSSDSPEMFFDDESIEALQDADLYVRAAEQMLRIQCERFVIEFGEHVDPAVLNSLRDTRKSVAMLRKSVANIVRLEKQLRPSTGESKYVQKFDMTPENLAILKDATNRTYYL